MIELVRDPRVLNVLAKFENEPWKITEVRALTVIFHVRSWKIRKKIRQIFFVTEKTWNLYWLTYLDLPICQFWWL